MNSPATRCFLLTGFPGSGGAGSTNVGDFTRKKRQQAGFTLLELMVVAVILAAMMGLGTLAVRGFGSASARNTAARQLISAVEEARATALQHGTDAHLVFMADSSLSGDDRNWRSVGVFWEDPSRTSSHRQVGEWVVFREGAVFLQGAADPDYKTFFDAPTTGSETVSVNGTSKTLPAITFNSHGRVANLPPSEGEYIGVSEGSYASGSAVPTYTYQDSNSEPATVFLRIRPTTGRATIID